MRPLSTRAFKKSLAEKTFDERFVQVEKCANVRARFARHDVVGYRFRF